MYCAIYASDALWAAIPLIFIYLVSWTILDIYCSLIFSNVLKLIIFLMVTYFRWCTWVCGAWVTEHFVLDTSACGGLTCIWLYVVMITGCIGLDFVSWERDTYGDLWEHQPRTVRSTCILQVFCLLPLLDGCGEDCGCLRLAAFPSSVETCEIARIFGLAGFSCKIIWLLALRVSYVFWMIKSDRLEGLMVELLMKLLVDLLSTLSLLLLSIIVTMYSFV